MLPSPYSEPGLCPFSDFDPEEEAQRIGTTQRRQVWEVLSRRGLVVGMSGGVDSSVCAALAVRALGNAAVFGLMLPEAEGDPTGLEAARGWARTLGIPYAVEDITDTLTAVGCYRRRDETIRSLIPAYGGGWRCKLVLSGEHQHLRGLSVFHLLVVSPAGETFRSRLGPHEYREIVAATSFKQRIRTTMLYYHADRLHFAAVGTPNRLEFDQGFFVKGGDGLADVKPIAHLYKTQVYRLAEYLQVPSEILERPPSSDTYSLPQSQAEFYFRLPLQTLDQVLWARNAGKDAETSSRGLGLTPDEVDVAFQEIERKREATRYLHMPPLLADSVPEMQRRRRSDL